MLCHLLLSAWHLGDAADTALSPEPFNNQSYTLVHSMHPKDLGEVNAV
jgi:hypothetical protein